MSEGRDIKEASSSSQGAPSKAELKELAKSGFNVPHWLNVQASVREKLEIANARNDELKVEHEPAIGSAKMTRVETVRNASGEPVQFVIAVDQRKFSMTIDSIFRDLKPKVPELGVSLLRAIAGATGCEKLPKGLSYVVTKAGQRVRIDDGSKHLDDVVFVTPRLVRVDTALVSNFPIRTKLPHHESGVTLKYGSLMINVGPPRDSNLFSHRKVTDFEFPRLRDFANRHAEERHTVSETVMEFLSSLKMTRPKFAFESSLENLITHLKAVSGPTFSEFQQIRP